MNLKSASAIKHFNSTAKIQLLVGRLSVSLFKLLVKSLKNFSLGTESCDVLLATSLQDVADQFGVLLFSLPNNIIMKLGVLHLVLEDIIKKC